LGRAYALELARRGAKVVVNDLGADVNGVGASSTFAEKVVEEIIEAGGEAIASPGSVTSHVDIAAMIGQVMARWGRIDILVCNAGILRDRSFSKMDNSEFEAVFAVHVYGTLKPIKAVWDIMKSQNYGRIVVATSSAGLFGNFGQTNYAAAKMAVLGLMNTLKIEGEKNNIRVNAIAPAARTRMTGDLMGPADDTRARPDQVSPGVTYLVSEDAPSGIILCATSGFFTVAKMCDTKGVYLGTKPTAEDVRNQWEGISDPAKLYASASAAEQYARIMAEMTSIK
jgi:methylmalonyl-CoA mutase cobalamin-binding domain/chain